MMPANGTLDTTSVAAQTVLTEAAKLKTKDWFPSPQQATVVATILWNVAAAGFSLNAILLLRYLKVKWYLLPLPPPTIMVNLCVSNLLLVLGVLLATLTLTFDLGERGVHAGRVQLFLSVCVLLQSWLGQVMMAWCGSWAGEQGYQWRAGSVETSQSLADEGCSGKRGRTHSVGSRSTWGQRFLYQPCRRHSNLSQTAAGRICSEEAPVSCSGESFPAGTVPSLTSQRRNTVKWWLVWAWLLTILAAIVLLMTTTDDQNVCKTLDPFRRRYQILGDDISQISYSEDSLLKIPIILVLLPVYLVGIGIIIRQAFPRAQSHPHRGRSSSQSNQARPGNAQKGRRQRCQKLEVRFESLGERSTCNINMNALKHWGLEEKQQNASSERPDSTETGTELEDVQPEDRNKNAVFISTVGNQQHTRKADKAVSSEVEGAELEMDSNDSSIPRDERDAAFLLFVDDDTAKPIDRMPQSCLQPRETSAEEQVTTLAFDDTIDLALFELDEYVIYFNDTELEKSRSPLRYESEASLLSTASQQQAAVHSPGLPQGSEDKDNSSTHDAPGKALANEANADQYHKRDHCGHRPVVSEGGLEGEQDGIFLEGCDPDRSGALSKSSGKYNDMNNHASKRLFMGGKAQKKMAGGQCPSNKSKTADPDTDSMSSGGDSNSFSNSKLYTTLASAAAASPQPARTQPPSREESDARQLQHELPRLTDQRSVHSAEGPGNGGAGGPVGAPKIVSSSMHHFTVQGRPRRTGHFQLYPAGYLNQARFHPLPYPETQFQQQQVRRAAARSRLSSSVSAHHYSGAAGPQGVRRPLIKQDLGENQASKTDGTEQAQSQAPFVQSCLGQHVGEDPVRDAEKAPSWRRNLSMKDSAAQTGNGDLLDSALSDDVYGHDPSEQGRAVPFSDQPDNTAVVCHCEPPNAASRQKSRPLNDAQGLPSHKVTAVGDGARPTANSARSLWSKTFRPFATAAAAERFGNNGGGLSSGDRTGSAPEAKRSCARIKRRRRSTRGRFPCRKVSYNAKCLVGLVMHALLCLPLAVVLAPGVWLGVDCGSRLQMLLVVRLLMFCHVIVCPLWLLSFHCDTELLKRR